MRSTETWKLAPVVTNFLHPSKSKSKSKRKRKGKSKGKSKSKSRWVKVVVVEVHFGKNSRKFSERVSMSIESSNRISEVRSKK